jgi:arginine/lysine/ornithine decarboxylase
VVNICSDKIDLYEFEDALQKLESTSPSYLLMASLDFNCDVLESRGSELMRKWRENLDWFYERAQAIEGLAVMKHAGLDDSKINLDMSSRGLDGLALEKELMKRHIFPELVTGNLVMCMTGIGNKRCDYEALAAALTDISRIFPPVEHRTAAVSTWQFKNLQQHAVPTRKIRLPLDDACGRVCAQSIIPYPPGIPMVCPGEEISREIIDYVKELRDLGENVMGVDDEGRVVVGY